MGNCDIKIPKIIQIGSEKLERILSDTTEYLDTGMKIILSNAYALLGYYAKELKEGRVAASADVVFLSDDKPELLFYNEFKLDDLKERIHENYDGTGIRTALSRTDIEGLVLGAMLADHLDIDEDMLTDYALTFLDWYVEAIKNEKTIISINTETGDYKIVEGDLMRRLQKRMQKSS